MRGETYIHKWYLINLHWRRLCYFRYSSYTQFCTKPAIFIPDSLILDESESIPIIHTHFLSVQRSEFRKHIKKPNILTANICLSSCLRFLRHDFRAFVSLRSVPLKSQCDLLFSLLHTNWLWPLPWVSPTYSGNMPPRCQLSAESYSTQSTQKL